jgi:hypothetical protein
MPAGKRREREPIEKSRRLPADKLVEVEDCDFLRQRQGAPACEARDRRFGADVREGLGQPGRCRV